MPITARQDKKNWDWLPELYKKKIIAIREAVTRLWDEHSTKPQLGGFTPHGPEHSKSVEDIIHRLIPDEESFNKLTERERFYLLASAWVHDIGMIRGIEEGDAKLAPEQIRAIHHKRSEIFIINNCVKICVDPEDAPSLGLLAYYHGEDLEDCKSVFPVGNNDVVKLALIAAYLRLADALDISQSRAPLLNYAICLAYNIPMSSKLHWIKSRLISGIEISPKDHRITVNFKTPHDEDHQENSSFLQKQNLARLQKLVMNDLRTHIDSNMSVLVRAGISYFLDIDYCTTQMEIDEQVRPELSRLVYNFEMMVHPSATKLMHILLETINDIIEPYKDLDADKGINDKLSEDLQRFIKEIREEILDNRRCHLGLKRLIDDFDKLFHNKKTCIKDLKERVDTEIENLDKERDAVRAAAFKYLGMVGGDNGSSKVLNYTAKVRNALEKRNDLQSWTSLSEYLSSIIQDGNYINVLVYALSELVIKSICGFRDHVIKILLEDSSIREKIRPHKDNIEEIASTLIRVFVCEGQPKTITGKNDRLTYHDGTKYAIELHRRGFNNIMIVPDLVAGSLLSEISGNNRCFIDYVMLGMNGLEYISAEQPMSAHFLHSSGHLAIAALTRSVKLQGNGRKDKPRLILVLSRSKCAINQDDHEALSKSSNASRSDDITVREGFRFWTRNGSRPIRTQPFFIRDEDVRAELFNAGISLYNPREDSVMLAMVDDIIADGECFIDISNGDILEGFRKWLYGVPRRTIRPRSSKRVSPTVS